MPSAVDERRAMDPGELARAIAADRAAGWLPAAVVATVGTTSTTAVDPVGAIADVCAAEGIWLHVDAAYAGAVALLPGDASSLRGLGASRLDRRQPAQVALHAVRLLAAADAPHGRRSATPSASCRSTCARPAAARPAATTASTSRSWAAGPAASRCGCCCATSAWRACVPDCAAHLALAAELARPSRPSQMPSSWRRCRSAWCASAGDPPACAGREAEPRGGGCARPAQRAAPRPRQCRRSRLPLAHAHRRALHAAHRHRQHPHRAHAMSTRHGRSCVRPAQALGQRRSAHEGVARRWPDQRGDRPRRLRSVIGFGGAGAGAGRRRCHVDAGSLGDDGRAEPLPGRPATPSRSGPMASWAPEQVEGLLAVPRHGLRYTHEVNDRSGRLSATGYWATNHPDPAFDRDDDDGDGRWEEAEVIAGSRHPQPDRAYTTAVQLSRWHAKRQAGECHWAWDRRRGEAEDPLAAVARAARRMAGGALHAVLRGSDYPRVESTSARPRSRARRPLPRGAARAGPERRHGDIQRAACVVGLPGVARSGHRSLDRLRGHRQQRRRRPALDLRWTRQRRPRACGPVAGSGVRPDGVVAAVGYFDGAALDALRALPHGRPREPSSRTH